MMTQTLLALLCGAMWGIALERFKSGDSIPIWFWVFLVGYSLMVLNMPRLDRMAAKAGIALAQKRNRN